MISRRVLRTEINTRASNLCQQVQRARVTIYFANSKHSTRVHAHHRLTHACSCVTHRKHYVKNYVNIELHNYYVRVYIKHVIYTQACVNSYAKA